jgi:hypothetical protein
MHGKGRICCSKVLKKRNKTTQMDEKAESVENEPCCRALVPGTIF